MLNNSELKQLQAKIKKWDDKEDSLAGLDDFQLNLINEIEELNTKNKFEEGKANDKAEELKEFLVIESIPKFLTWFNDVEEEFLNFDDDVYKKFFNQLEEQNRSCEILLNEIDSTLNALNKLTTEYNFVNTKTSSLNEASENLMDEQRQLISLSDDIKFRLKHFTQAEHLIQRLQNPTFSPSSNDQFAEIINNIDDCMKFLKDHPQFKEANFYHVKYRQCLLKAVQMIRNYVTQALSAATDQILNPKTKEKVQIADKTSDAAFALYYGKFQTSSIKIKGTIRLVEDRHHKTSEYEDLLNELHQFYLSQRALIMSSGVESAVKNLCVKHKGDHCALFRASCNFMVHICQDEHRLFYQFFTVKGEQLSTYIEGLCTILYDNIRPLTIHINHLETLAEICSILRVEMLDEHVANNAEALEAFGRSIQQMLEDVQERLVFRAHLYLQSDILNYNPSGGDLAYPEKLEMMESIATSLLQENQTKYMRSESRNSIVSFTSTNAEVEQQFKSRTGNSPADLHGMWFPTVRRTLVCLSRLYRCVDRPIFQGLSQEALTYCIQSLANAEQSITSKKSSVDGKLFEIKHLLILREQIAPFRVDFQVKQTSLDFSKVKTAAYELLQKRKQLFALGTNNALLEFLLEGTPQVKEHLLDSRKDVDRQLKASCEQFIIDITKQMVGPIILFIENAQNLLKHQQAQTSAINQQPVTNLLLRQTPWASPQQISSLIQESQRHLKTKLAGIQRSMQLYLSNKDTEFILFRPIRNNIIGSFMRLEQLLVTNGYSKEDLTIVGLPTADQISVIISSASLIAETKQEANDRKMNEGEGRKISTSSIDKKVSFDCGNSILENLKCN